MFIHQGIWRFVLLTSVLGAGEALVLAQRTAAPGEAKLWGTKVEEGVALLDQRYWSPTLSIWLDRPGDDLRAHFEGRRNPPWWPSANAVELLIDEMNRTGGHEHQRAIETLYQLWKDPVARLARVTEELKRRQQWSAADDLEAERRRNRKPPGPNDPPSYYSDFQNEYLDDSGWWGVAWVKMYDRTGEEKYLHTGETIHAHMARNWRPEKGGGILWCEDEDKQRPNSITNNLFLILSARLYVRTGRPEYLSWAIKTESWIRENGLFNGVGVTDGPGHHGDYWNYNQGAYIGGLTELYAASGEEQYLQRAIAVVQGVLEKSGLVSAEGILIEKIGVGGDAALFKGIAARYYGQFRQVLLRRGLHPELAAAIERCLRASAAGILANAQGENGLYKAEWQPGGNEGRTDFDTQLSALLALQAAAEL